jgi:uncharacterized protein YmfQ (DUF2313 family)
MTCSNKRPPFYCPTHEDLTRTALHLLPRGRIWGNNDGEPAPTTVMYRFWHAVAAPFHYVNSRLCALREEFFCKTHSETNDLWLSDYGLPDGCDPFPNLCAKVAAQGGATCAYLRALARDQGWDIDCNILGCGGEAGCAEAGLSAVGRGLEAGAIIIVIYINTSPAYAPIGQPFGAGCIQAGQVSRCDPFEGLKCFLERVIHAHIKINYTIVEI